MSKICFIWFEYTNMFQAFETLSLGFDVKFVLFILIYLKVFTFAIARLLFQHHGTFANIYSINDRKKIYQYKFYEWQQSSSYDENKEENKMGTSATNKNWCKQITKWIYFELTEFIYEKIIHCPSRFVITSQRISMVTWWQSITNYP